MFQSALDNKIILITGGTGSFGKKFVEIALKKHNPKIIRVFSRDELKQFQMQQELQDERVRYLVGDVRDKQRLSRAFEGVDIVIHAAALKQVPSCEYNPFEAVKTNILGAQNVIEAAIDNGVKQVMNISTDKSVNPVNLYGATKLCAERLFVQGNAYVGEKRTRMSCVRYGNVVGSRGSVIPVFLKQKELGVLTITDERMTRFFITKEQAVQFVIDCLEIMRGGEIFVPKIPSMKITDLANVIAPGVKKKIIGIRPGEKIHELLLSEGESRRTKEFARYYRIEPEYCFWEEKRFESGESLPEGFSYASNTNNEWISPEDLKVFLKDLKLED